MKDSLKQLTAYLRVLGITIQERDENTAAHSDRTCELAVALGKHCDLTSRELNLLRIASPVHDIGKIGIPDKILLKPGKLDADEWEIMKTHSERGYHILSSIEDEDMAIIANTVRHHHESFDGNGYPHQLSGEQIPLLSRILALADSYDAMATTRAYHQPRTHSQIMTILHEENSGKYDPHLRNIFSGFIETSPFRARSA
jgi:HD-GYP domain-containing protein (c-di-GMP phosphodiesterase class II)